MGAGNEAIAKVEGHFPGASETTLAKLKLLGTDCDHEAMTGQEVFTVLCKVTLFPKKFFNPPRFRSFTERIVGTRRKAV